MRARWMYSPMGTYLSFFSCGTGDQIGPETAVIIPPRGEDALTRLKRPPPHREHTSFRGRVTAHDLGIIFTWGGEQPCVCMASLPTQVTRLS